MYVYGSSDTNPYRVFAAAAAIENGAFSAVKLASGGVTPAGADDTPIGILSGGTQETCAAGEDVNVVVSGGTLWKTSEKIAAGDFLTAGADGLAKKAAEGNFIFAQALESGAANSAIKVLIVRAGKA